MKTVTSAQRHRGGDSHLLPTSPGDVHPYGVPGRRNQVSKSHRNESVSPTFSALPFIGEASFSPRRVAIAEGQEMWPGFGQVQ